MASNEGLGICQLELTTEQALLIYNVLDSVLIQLKEDTDERASDFIPQIADAKHAVMVALANVFSQQSKGDNGLRTN